MLYLIDTDVMIDLSREKAEAADDLDSLSDPAVSIGHCPETDRRGNGLRLEAPQY